MLSGSELRWPLVSRTCSAAVAKHKPCVQHVCNCANIWNSIRMSTSSSLSRLPAHPTTPLAHSWVKRPGKE